MDNTNLYKKATHTSKVYDMCVVKVMVLVSTTMQSHASEESIPMAPYMEIGTRNFLHVRYDG